MHFVSLNYNITSLKLMIVVSQTNKQAFSLKHGTETAVRLDNDWSKIPGKFKCFGAQQINKKENFFLLVCIMFFLAIEWKFCEAQISFKHATSWLTLEKLKTFNKENKQEFFTLPSFKKLPELFFCYTGCFKEIMYFKIVR